MLRVYTRYGYGKYAQVKLVTMAVVNPVVDLNAKLDSSTKGLVHLTWKASPGSSDIQVRNIEHLMRCLFQGGALLRATVNSGGGGGAVKTCRPKFQGFRRHLDE